MTPPRVALSATRAVTLVLRVRLRISDAEWQLESLGVQLPVEHFNPFLQLLDAGEQSPSFIVERADALPSARTMASFDASVAGSAGRLTLPSG